MIASKLLGQLQSTLEIVLDANNFRGKAGRENWHFLHFQGPYRLSSNACSLAMLGNVVIVA